MQAIKFLARVKDGIIKEVWIIIRTLAEDYNPNRDPETGEYTTGTTKEESSTASNSTTQRVKPQKRLARSWVAKKDLPLRNKGFKILKGTRVGKVKVIVRGAKIRQAGRLQRTYKPNGDINDWLKVRCSCKVADEDGREEIREVHYYFHPSMGRDEGVEHKFPINPKQTGRPKRNDGNET